MFGFQYYLLSPHFVHPEYVDVFNTVYNAWEKSFAEVVESAGGTLDPDDFFRNDLITAVLHDNEVVTLATMTLFDLRLRSSLEHHYIKALKPETIENLKKDQLNRLVSVEYLNVLPKWRKNNSQIRWTEVAIGLCYKIYDDSIADILMGMPRTDVKVLDVGKTMYAIEVQEPILKMNYPCAVTIVHKTTDREFNNPLTSQYVNGLYATHQVTGLQPLAPETIPSRQQIKKAA